MFIPVFKDDEKTTCRSFLVLLFIAPIATESTSLLTIKAF